jgi:uncharacterized protein YjbI with pentapeptide repeats
MRLEELKSMAMSAQEIRSRLSAPVPVGEAVDLRGVELREPLVLDDLDIASVDLGGAVFHGPVSFRRARLAGLSWFKGCVFRDVCCFSGARFANDARFDRTAFHGPFEMVMAEVHGAADFNRCVFGGTATFEDAVFLGNLSFEAVAFDKKAILRGAQCLGGLWSDGAAFRGAIDVAGMDVHGRSWLRGVRLDAEGAGRSTQTLGSLITSYGYQWS